MDDTSSMKIMMEPGGALLVMAVVAFFARFLLVKLPVIGGLVGWVLGFAIVFGIVGGVFLLITGRKKAA